MAMLGNSNVNVKLKKEDEDESEERKKQITYGKPAHSGDDIMEANQQTNKQQKLDRYMRKHVFVASRNRTFPSLSRQ